MVSTYSQCAGGGWQILSGVVSREVTVLTSLLCTIAIRRALAGGRLDQAAQGEGAAGDGDEGNRGGAGAARLCWRHPGNI